MNALAPSRAAPIPLGGALVFGAVAVMLASAWPLLTYSLSLAVFGLAHVAYELRYVDRRFSARLGRALRVGIGALLGGVVIGRVLLALGWVGSGPQGLVELALGVALVALTVPTLFRFGRGRGLLGLALGAALVVGMALSPVHTFLLIAVAHNLTPLGFLAEGLAGSARRRALSLGLLLFVGLPLLVASGLPSAALAGVGLGDPNASVLPTGPLAAHLGAYLPPEWRQAEWAPHAFSGVVVAQLMHYAAVIGVLPRLEQGVGSIPWPRGFPLIVAGATLILLGGYLSDFSGTRALYGIAATVHSWVELPLLLLACCALAPGGSPQS